VNDLSLIAEDNNNSFYSSSSLSNIKNEPTTLTNSFANQEDELQSKSIHNFKNAFNALTLN